jgi:hypothetical protein
LHKPLAFLTLLALLAPVPAQADGGLGFQYTIERERAGSITEGSFLRGFDTGEGLSLRIKLRQASYCYVLMGEANGRIRLAFPDPRGHKMDALSAGQWAKTPKSTFVRVGDDPGVERMYLVVSTQRIAELEQAFAVGATSPRESLAIDVRDRFQREGSYSRDIEGGTVTVKYRPKGVSAQSVVVEEISLRARR